MSVQKKADDNSLAKAIHIPYNTADLKDKVWDSFAVEPKDIWVLFVYAQDFQETDQMLNTLKSIYKYHWIFSGPTAVYYLEGGFEKLPNKNAIAPNPN